MKTVKTQFATAATADFQDMTMTFEMSKDFRAVSGNFAIVDKQQYDKIIKSLKELIDCNGKEVTAENSAYISKVHNDAKEVLAFELSAAEAKKPLPDERNNIEGKTSHL